MFLNDSQGLFFVPKKEVKKSDNVFEVGPSVRIQSGGTCAAHATYNCIARIGPGEGGNSVRSTAMYLQIAPNETIQNFIDYLYHKKPLSKVFQHPVDYDSLSGKPFLVREQILLQKLGFRTSLTKQWSTLLQHLDSGQPAVAGLFVSYGASSDRLLASKPRPRKFLELVLPLPSHSRHAVALLRTIRSPEGAAWVMVADSNERSIQLWKEEDLKLALEKGGDAILVRWK